MAAIFQINRGSGSISLVDGELYINKGPDSLQYAVGEREITLAKLDELNSGSLYIQGGISASGDITASNMFISGNLHISGNLFLGNSGSDTITATGEFTSHIIPNPTDTYNLGSDTKRWGRMFANSVSASAFTGSLYGMGDPTSFSTSVDLRLDRVEASSSLYDNVMSGSNRLYVSPEGFDTNDGKDPSTPFKTIKAAVESLGAAEYTNIKRYTIFVGSGNYTEQNPIVVPPGIAIVGDTLRTVRLTAANPTKDFFHTHDSNYFYGLRFLDLQYPSFAFSFPCSTATATISGGGVSALTMIHTATGYQNGENVSVIIEGPDAGGTVATATATVSGGTLSITMVSNGSGYVAGEKPHVSIQAPTSKRPLITTSPYVQNCSSITGPFNTSGTKVQAALPYDINALQIDEQGAGGGIRIDGNLTHPNSPLESFVADAFTQVNQGGPGHLVINKGYAQFVSCFTTFCTYGFKVVNGGFANISNSVIDFGAKGLVSKTYFPQTYNTGSSLQTLTSTVAGAVILENGAGYTGSVANVTISGGGGSGATAEATVNANGSINEIVILTPGSGYTSQPNVTIATPTGAGAIQATTVAGKANISGIAAILFQLESGSRGVDVSSNMILSGTDYLVTNVATGSSANQRYVTVYPAPPSITTGNSVYFHQLSNISTGGLVMEYVGSGVTYNALPKYGGVPIRTKEIIEFAPGRVFYSTVDNIGNLKIGDFFSVNQLTGEVTIDANSFNLSGLNAIGPFRRNGVAVGVVLQEVSNNTTLLNSQGLFGEDTTPTQYAVKEYVQAINTSLDARLDKLEQTSGSLNTFSSSALIRLANLETTSGSNNIRLNNLESKSASVDVSLAQLNSYTSSLKQAITASGTNVTINGNLTVKGTTTQIDSTTLNIGDNIIELNYGGSQTFAGIYTKDATGTLSSGSLLWNASIDRWIAGASGSESRILLAGGDGVLSGSTDFSAFSTSVNSRLSNLELKSASVDISISNINSTTASLSSSVGNLNRATASLYSSASLMTASISSLTSSVSALQSFSGNVNTRFDNLQTYTTSVDSRFTTLATYTGSVNTRFTEVGVVTASLITSASLVSSSVWHLHQFSSSENGKSATLATYTGSVESRFTSLATISGSLILSASAVSSSVWNLNQFSASATASLERMTASIDDHEERIVYIEGINGITGGNPLTQLHIFSASAKISIANLETFTSSANTRLTALEVETANLESFTSSINTTIKTKLNADGVLSGSNQVLGGTNIVSASTDSSTVDFTITNGNITANLIGGVVSGSSQVIGILSSLNSFTSSIDTTIKTKLNADGVISGSIQILGGSSIHSSSIGNYRFNSIGVNTAASGVAGEIQATGDITAYYSSDIRLKENVTPIPNALEKVNKISGNTYDWKEGYDEVHSHKGNDVGVIAQEIEQILPQIVTNRDSGFKAVQYEKMIPLLIEAIKELSAKVDRLENK